MQQSAARRLRIGLLLLSMVLVGAFAISASAAGRVSGVPERNLLSSSAQAADPGAPKKPPNEHLGVNPWGAEAFLLNADEFASTNVGSIRIDLPWEQVQPRPGVFTWDVVDKVVDTAQANRMDILITLRAISSWGTQRPANARDGYHGASLPLDMNAWETFVSTMALRYKGRHVS